MAPRRCPSEVFTHRIELGTAERQQVKKMTAAYSRDKYLENIPNIMLGVAGVLAGAGVIGIGYSLYKVAESISLEFITKPIKDFSDDVKAGYQNVKDGTKTTVSEIVDTLAGQPMTHPYTYTTENPPQPTVKIDPITGEECLSGTPDWKDEHGVWHAGTPGTCSSAYDVDPGYLPMR